MLCGWPITSSPVFSVATSAAVNNLIHTSSSSVSVSAGQVAGCGIAGAQRYPQIAFVGIALISAPDTIRGCTFPLSLSR